MNGTRSQTMAEQMRGKNPNPVLFQYPHDTATLDPGKSKITFYEHDRRQLKSPHFLNDTIISFFLQFYVDTEVSPELRNRIYLFDNFFIQKIKSIKEKKTIAGDTSILSYNCASKWLGGAKIFDKDFLVMPICEKDHWVLVIICYPANKAVRCCQKIPDEELSEPAVFVLNSHKGLAPAVKKTLGQFLQYQWQRERKETRIFSIHNAKTLGIRLLFPNLPQQKNHYDCGVYILQFFYCFLKDPRKAYIKMFRKHNMRNWFKENNVDIMWARRRMTNLIKEQILAWESDSSNRNDHLTDDNHNQVHHEVHIEPSSQSDSSAPSGPGEDESINGNTVIVIH